MRTFIGCLVIVSLIAALAFWVGYEAAPHHTHAACGVLM